MKKPNEDDILETTLSIAEKGYPEAYRFLLNAYEESPSSFGPQTFYFLACLAGGANMLDLALVWLRKAIQENSWWYRPEVLEDDDFAALKNDAAFLSLKAISDDRYAAAVSKSTAIFSWKKKMADNLFLAIHGNTQNGDVARADWEPIVGTSGLWQLETVQSAEPDGYGTYRWSYDSTSYLPVAASIESVQNEGYHKIACGGFSAGCDIINLFNGSGMDLVDNLCQIVFAITVGFLLVTIFCRGGSLLPCIIVHSAINTLGTFANDANLTTEMHLLHLASLIVITVAYTLILTRTLPKAQQAKRN